MSETKPTVRIAANDVLSAAIAIKDAQTKKIATSKAAWLRAALNTPVRRGKLWWSRDHYRTEAECLAEYYEARGWDVSIEYWIRNAPDRAIESAEEYIALANAALKTGDGWVTLTSDGVQFLGLHEKEARS